MIDKKDCVGKRILYTYGWLSVFEGVMQEISPSEDYVKIDNTWYRSYQIEIKEILRFDIQGWDALSCMGRQNE